LAVQSAARHELEELRRRVQDLESLVKEQSSTIRRLETVETDWKAKRSRPEEMRLEKKPLAELYGHHFYRRKEYTESVRHAVQLVHFVTRCWRLGWAFHHTRR
jgi:predicted nuclease with TOPRIM domain